MQVYCMIYSLMPRMSIYLSIMEISFRLFRLLNTLTLPNFVTPVRKANGYIDLVS